MLRATFRWIRQLAEGDATTPEQGSLSSPSSYFTTSVTSWTPFSFKSFVLHDYVTNGITIFVEIMGGDLFMVGQ